MYTWDRLGVWDRTHIDDIAALYTLILAKILKWRMYPLEKRVSSQTIANSLGLT